MLYQASVCAGGAVIHEVLDADAAGHHLAEDIILARIADTAAAIEYLHSQTPSIAHRDIKLENMLLMDTARSADTITKLCDFGSCSTWQGSLSRASDITRMADVVDRTTTPHYRPPELADLHLRMHVGPKVDVWALGVALYKLMFHVTPFEDAAGNSQRMGILSGKVKVPSGHQYSAAVVDLMRACLTYDPNDRPTIHDIIVQGSQTCTAWPARHCRVHMSGRGALSLPASASSGSRRQPQTGRGTLGESLVQGPSTASVGSNSMDIGSSSVGQRGGGFQRTLAGTPTMDDPWAEDEQSSGGAFHDAGSGTVALSPVGLDDSATPAAASGGQDPFAAWSNHDGAAHTPATAPAASGQAKSQHGPDGSSLTKRVASMAAGLTAAVGGLRKNSGRPAATASSVFDEPDSAAPPSALAARAPAPLHVHERQGSARSKRASGPPGSVGPARGVLESVQTRMMQLFGGGQEKRRWVIKATSGLTPGPPKLKYVRRLVLDAYDRESADATYSNLARLPLGSDPVVAIKACVLLLRLWQQGPPLALATAGSIAQDVSGIRDTWRSLRSTFQRETGGAPQSCPAGEMELADFTASYAAALASKISLHSRRQDFSPLFTAGGGQLGEVVSLAADVRVASKLPSSYSNLSVATELVDYLDLLVAAHTVGVAITDPAVRAVVALLGSARRPRAGTDGSLASMHASSAREWPVGPVEACVFGSTQPLLRETWNVFRAALAILLQLRSASLRSAAAAVNAGQEPVQTAAQRTLTHLCDRLEAHLGELRKVHASVARATQAGAHPCLDVLDGLPELPASSPFTNASTAAELLASSRGPRGALEGGALGSPSPLSAGPGPGSHYSDGQAGRVVEADEGIHGLRTDGSIATGAGSGIPARQGMSAGAAGDWAEDDDSDREEDGLQQDRSRQAGEEGSVGGAALRFFKRIGRNSADESLLGETAAAAAADGSPNADPMRASAWVCCPARVLLTDSTAAPVAKATDAEFNLQRALALVWSMPGHDTCVECAAKRPKWASVNMGVLLCLNCSGVHRQLGTHISKVHSLTLDQPRPAWLRRLLKVGNVRSNDFWLANHANASRLDPRLPAPPTAQSDMVSRSAWVKAKYISRKFVAPAAPADGSHDPASLAAAGYPLCRYLLKASSTEAARAAAASSSPDLAFATETADVVSAHAPRGGGAAAPAGGNRGTGADKYNPFTNDDDVPPPSEQTDPFTALATRQGSNTSDRVVQQTDDGWGTLSGVQHPDANDDPFDGQLPVRVVGMVKGGQEKTNVLIAVTDRAADPPRIAEDDDPFLPVAPPAGRHQRGSSHASGASTLTSSSDDLFSLKGNVRSHNAGGKAIPQQRVSHGGQERRAGGVVAVAPPQVGLLGAGPVVDVEHDSSLFHTANGSESSAGESHSLPGSPSAEPLADTEGLWVPPVPEQFTAAGAAASTGGDAAAATGGASRGSALAEQIDTLWSAHIEIAWTDIQIGERIGTGGFAEVFRGVYRGTEVAVKKLLHKPSANGKGKSISKAVTDFKAEVTLMTRLRHPNIVLFMGVVTEPLSLVTEFCSRGNLFDLLHNPKIPLTWSLRQQMALDAARGMNFLHTSQPIIIHRDLKSLNLLVDDRWAVKVADFGLARFKASTGSAGLYTAQCGTMQWMAPEVIAGHRYTEKADVFSFGINLWELLTRDIPYRGMQAMQVGYAVLNAGLRPPIPPDAPKPYATLIKACLRADAKKRPTFAQIIAALSEMIKVSVGQR